MKLLRLTVAALALLPVLASPALAQAPDPTFQSQTLYSTGTVYFSRYQADGKRVLAGSFSRVNGAPVSNLVRFEANGALDVPFVQNVGTTIGINKAPQLANGKYLLIALSSQVTAAGQVGSSLLRLNGDGTADATFNAGVGAVDGSGFGYVDEVVEQPDGKMLAVGLFDYFNSVGANNVVRINADGTVDPTFNAGSGADDEVITAALQPDGKLLIGGFFTSVNGNPCAGIARLNANGSFDTSFSSPLADFSYASQIIRQPDGKLLIAGDLVPTGGSGNGGGLLRLNANGSVDNTFNAPNLLGGQVGLPFYDQTVSVQPDGKILIGGTFRQATGAPGNGVARLNADGSVDNTFQAGSALAQQTGPVYTLVLQPNGTVLVGGSFSGYGSNYATPLVQLTSTGAVDPSFAPLIQRPGSVLALAQQADGKLLVGGNFTEIQGQAARRVARLNADGSVDAAFTNNVGAILQPVNAMVLQPDGKLVLGAGGQVMRLTTAGAPDNTFTSYTQGGVSRLALQTDGKILAGGQFIANTGAGITYHLLRLLPTGQPDPSFSVSTSSFSSFGTLNRLSALAVQPDGRILAAAVFTGPASSRIVRLTPTGSVDPSFDSSPTITTGASAATVNAVVVQSDGKILIGGAFSNYGTTPQSRVTRLNPNGALDATFTQNYVLSGSVSALAIQPNGRILLGGGFNSGVLPSNLARLLANGQADASFASTAVPNSTVAAILVQPTGTITIGGSFSSVGSRASVGVARLTAPNVLAIGAPAAVVARTQAWPVPAHTVLHVQPDAAAHPRTVELTDVMGRPVRAAAALATTDFDLRGLAPGVYIVRVTYAAGVVLRRVVVE